MAVVEIKVTPAGESITHATLLKWLKPEGAAVKAGEAVAELETDKATKEEYAPATGVLSIRVQPNARVAIGDVIGAVDPAGTPRAAAAPPPTPATSAPTATAAPAGSDVRVSPAARVQIDTQGLDARQIPPSDRGVVTKTEVQAYVDTRSKPATPAPAATPVATPVAPPRTAARETRVPMTPIRARIAERLLSAQQNAAILTTFNEADMSRVMELRAKYKDGFQKKHGVGLGFMSFFVKACVEALRAFPAVNARIDGNEIVYNNHYSFGVAVSTERGLMVPVLRDCETLSFAGIEKGIAELAVRARDNKITVADLQGGTFTITNGGIFGSLLSTPILNPPQSGILGMHAIQKRPVVVDDQIVIRPMMYLALSYDHRIIDGREAVSFLVRVKECLENPERLLLEA
ncbi:MAG: 2-oxoglutarate dehydrogenase complex dihydrolipoyllysine-residue succinyltransferase [Gemmataceae bacterium]